MTSLKYFPFILVWSLQLISARTLPKAESQELQYFLNGKTRPLNYNILLNTHVENCDKICSYEGKINITVAVNEDIVDKNEKVTNIQLNADEGLKIALCKLQDDTGANIPVKFSFNKDTEILTVATSRELSRGKKYYLYFEFSGIHNDDMFGFYRSSYTTPKGVKRWLLTTQFQPNDARNAFPCFDEPKYKATFEMAITLSKKVADDGYKALFNTHIVKKLETPHHVTFIFSKTPYPMSTYLVAFIVSDFKVTEAIKFVSDYGPEKNQQKEYRTWGEEKYIAGGDAVFPQIVGSTAIQLLADYLGVGYAYPKMDQIGIPDFAAGAMENWGLVTYRERLLFYNKRTVSEATKGSIVNVIAHELTHQWFGDLVTLESWDYIWLNEGFATYLSYVISEKVAAAKLNSTSWNTIGQMIIDETQVRALETDALEHSRPLSIKVTNPSIVGSYFDSISYAKAASVLRMWSHALSEGVFRKGLNIYLNARREKNSVPRDLLKSFEKACNETDCIDHRRFGVVSDLFEDWHSTPGYPLVTVEKIGKTKYKISQERFLWYQCKNTSACYNKFNIPITYSVASKPQFENTKPNLWLKKNENSGEINVKQEEKWIILNNQHTGYFRINYDMENWVALTKQLKTDHCKIHESNRAQLINDVFSFGRSTYKDYRVGYDVAFNLAGYLINEKNCIPWESALNSFSFLNNKLTASKKYDAFRQYVMLLLKPRYDSLGLTVQNENSHLENLLRMQVGEWACSLGYKPCIEDALRLYKNPSALSSDVKKIVYCTAVREGGDEVWDNVWNLYSKSLDNVEQTMYLSTLGCSRSPKKLAEFLKKTITPNSGIRKQDYGATFSSVYKAGNIEAALKFLDENFEDIAKNFNGIDPLGPLLIGISAKLNTDKELTLMKDLKQKIEKSDLEVVRTAQVSIGKAIEIIESNIKWVRLKQESIESWLNNNKFASVDLISM